MRLDTLENKLEYKELIDFLCEIFTNYFHTEYSVKNLKKRINQNIPESFQILYENDKHEYFHWLFKFINQRINAISFLKTEYEKIYGLYTFDYILTEFLFAHKQFIDLNGLDCNNCNKQFLDNYLFSKYRHADKRLFLFCLKFKQISEREIETLLSMDLFNNAETEQMWELMCKYQNLTCKFIQKYINILTNPKLAYLIVRGNNQFFSCHWNVIDKIKRSSNVYEQMLNEI